VMVTATEKKTKAVKQRRCNQWWKYGPGSHDVH
jgi:hypothetical protein